jgi:hypothetical protein
MSVIMKKIAKALLIVITVCFGAAFLYFSWSMFSDIAAYHNIKNNGLTSQGCVAGYSYSTINGKDTNYKYDYTFIDQNGTLQFVTDKRDTFTHHEESEPVTIYYNPDDPTDFYVEGGKYGSNHTSAIGGTFAGFFVFFLITFTVIKRKDDSR